MNECDPGPGSRPPGIDPAEIHWHDGQPVSARFGKIYFHHGDGAGESSDHFREQNLLTPRLRRLASRDAFVVAEAGFGTGLNFLATWQAWRAASPPSGSTLHYLAWERCPLAPKDLARALALWPAFEDLAGPLLENYPPLVAGQHRIIFNSGQVRLTLFFGDIRDQLPSIQFKADAWLLDGLAPAIHPQIRDQQLMSAIAQRSWPGTTIRTLAQTENVRTDLEESGFTLEELPGLRQKLQGLRGTFTATDWKPKTAERNKSITIVGAGIAGTLLANNLAQRGFPVTVIDGANGPGAGASGNDQGAVYVKLGVDFNDQSQLALAALLHSQRFYRQSANEAWHPTGLLQMAWNRTEAERQARFSRKNRFPEEVVRAVDQSEAARLAGFDVPGGGLWFGNSGWLQPGILCRQLLKHPLIDYRFNFRISRLMPCNGRWHLSGEGGKEQATDEVILCAGHLTPQLLPVSGRFRFRTIRGQVTNLPEGLVAAPKAVICGPCYLNPVSNGHCLTGATFDLHNTNPEISQASHRENLEQISTTLPGLWTSAEPDPEHLGGRVAFRCTTHDYQPAVGPLADRNGKALEGVHLFTGLGSKGLAYAPLLAEYLADSLTGQPPALSTRLASRLRPARCRAPAREETVT